MHEILELRDGLQANVWRYTNSGAMLRMHRHNELEVNLVLRGRAQYLVNDRRFDLRPCTMIWLFPGQNHLLLNQSLQYEMWVLYFSCDIVKRTATAVDDRVLGVDDPGEYFCKQVGEDSAGWLSDLFQSVADRAGSTALFNAGVAYSLLAAWQQYQAAGPSALGTDLHPAVERAARLIGDEVDPMPMPELAKRSGLSISRLSKLFHDQTGVTLVEYRQRQSVQRFLRIYARGRRKSILQAALEAGFGSYAQFYKVFKRVIGIGPLEYRRKIATHSPTLTHPSRRATLGQ